MSIPASPPTGLSVARFRAGFDRAAALAGPVARRWLGQAAPGEYHSPFPARLRIGRAVIVVLALLWLAAGFHALGTTRAIVQTVGHDTAPSVAAAEAIRTGLAAANADFALAMLTNQRPDGPFLVGMRSRLGAVRTAIVDAAANITYGEEERGPILEILQGLGDYEDLVGRSIASAGERRSDFAFQADDNVQRTALAAAAKLGGVNADHLTREYEGYLGRWPVWWLAAAAVLLVGILIAVQVDVARTAKRLISPGLATATLAVVASSALVGMRLLVAQSDLRVAKADAFDSIYALSSARAVAADAEAAQSFYLLAYYGDAGRAKAYDAAFNARAAQLLGGGTSVTGASTVFDASPAEQRGSGYLGAELANITFPGEAKAAREAVQAWEAVRVSDAMFHVGLVNDPGAAQVSVSSDRPGGARHAFVAFDAALAKVLAINQAAFVSSIAAAEADDAPLGAALVAGFVVALASAWLGIRQRLDEYRF